MHFSGASGGYQGGIKKPCRDFSATGTCKWAQNCRYAHDIRPGGQDFGGPSNQIHHHQQQQAAVYKTKLCPQFLSGQCSFGVQCKFAHGEHELHSQFQVFNNSSQPHTSQQPQPLRQQQPPPPRQQQQQRTQSPQQQQQQRYHHQQLQDQAEWHALSVPQQTLPQQQRYQQQSLLLDGQAAVSVQQQQQQQMATAGQTRPRQAGVSYMDRVRAMCKALHIGDVGDRVSEEAMAAAVTAFQSRALFKENRFADGVEKYLPPM